MEVENNEDNENNTIKKVRSIFVLKKIFSLLNPHKELLILHFNKNLQNKFNIKIEDYKKESGIYKEYLENGVGKEYILYINILIFEGQYKNRKKNGKGKEYYENGNIKFDGEYLNGNKINGIGYDTNYRY